MTRSTHPRPENLSHSVFIPVLKESLPVIVPTAAAVFEQLADKQAPVLNLLALCRTQEYLHIWFQGPELPRRFARLLLKQGHPSLALEVAARALDKAYPDDHDLLYCRA